MQDYIEIAEKNGIELIGIGTCQFCGASTTRGVHECVELFSLGFNVLDYSKPSNLIYRFLNVDAHTLQHPELHGRWNNHFHLVRLHLVFHYGIKWNYVLSPKLSNYLNKYKVSRPNEFLIAPAVQHRGAITATDVLANSNNEKECQEMVRQWAQEVYASWQVYHELIDQLANEFIEK